jgi:hypothetical protein
MHQKHPRIISRESPHRARVRIHHNGIPTHGDIPYSLRPIPHGCVGRRAVDDLELVPVHVPRVGTRVEIIDYYFDAVVCALAKEASGRGKGGVLAFVRILLRRGWWLIHR